MCFSKSSNPIFINIYYPYPQKKSEKPRLFSFYWILYLKIIINTNENLVFINVNKNGLSGDIDKPERKSDNDDKESDIDHIFTFCDDIP